MSETGTRAAATFGLWAKVNEMLSENADNIVDVARMIAEAGIDDSSYLTIGNYLTPEEEPTDRALFEATWVLGNIRFQAESMRHPQHAVDDLLRQSEAHYARWAPNTPNP